MNELITQTA